MSSFAYTLVKPIIKAKSHREIYSMDLPTLRTYLSEEDGKQSKLPPPWFSKRYSITTKEILGSPVYVIQPKPDSRFSPGAKDKAPVIQFVHGGGFIFEAQAAHWAAVDKIIRKTGAIVWFCVYPLLPHATVYEASDMVFAAYAQMTETYGEGNITVIGDSAGAVLSVNLAHWLSKPETKLPQPKKIILVSPAQVIEKDHALRARMDAINPVDIMLNTELLNVQNQIMPARKGYDAFYEYPLEKGDFSKFPPLVVFVGTYEIFYPLVSDFLLRVRGAGVPVEYHEGKGLCHCWPYVPIVPECKRGLMQLIQAIG
ncbi:MAG: alpha/beta hydrolase [Clostridiales Family XIII bacterium]|jgi:acetyl esterase/lipase|nr:alpha/beta hydrolase [Clostridiales Family XIII bacterium]